MNTEPRGGVFDNPLMLHSEHTRVLGDALKRGDERARAEYKRGFWQGMSMAAIPALIACLMSAVSGLLFGLSFIQ